MSNLSKTNRCLLLLLVLLALTSLICQPSPLCANTNYQLKAKAKDDLVSDFALRYNDADGDKLFSLDELIPGTFTGVTSGFQRYTSIIGVPINGWFSPLTDGPSLGGRFEDCWSFKGGYFDSTASEFGGYWTYSQIIVSTSVPSEKIEQWKFVMDSSKGSGNLTLIEKQGGSVIADGNWLYNYQGQAVTGAYSNAAVKIAGSSISVSGSGLATNPSAPPGYQTSSFTSIYKGTAFNGHGSGTYTTTFTTYGWPASLSGSWEGTRTLGSGITAESFSQYNFTYAYNNGLTDYYKGYFFAPTGYNGYKVGYTKNVTDENKQTGKYTITAAMDIGSDNSKNGQVFVTSYYDGDTTKKSLPVVNPAAYKGTNFLGSELGYIKNAGVGVYQFGKGFYEADAGDTYTFRYTYGNGDYYEGKVYRDPLSTVYYPGYKLNTVNELGKTGFYEIKGVSHSNVASSLWGKVYVTKYYDGNKPTPLTFTGDKLLPANPAYSYFGANYLKSELGFIKNANVLVYRFGMGLYEADAGDTYTYRYTYGNGDYYEGKFYADPLSTAYYPGKKINVVNELKLTGYYQILGVSHANVAGSLWGKVYVTKYYDGNKTTPLTFTGAKLLPANPAYSYFGANYLKSELGFIKNANVLVYRFGMGLYEADAGDTYTFRYTYTNGDYYEGRFYADPLSTVYYPGYKLNTVNELKLTGYYEIKGVSHSKVDSSKYGQVFLTKYYDGNLTKKSFLPVTSTLAKGTNYLKSELGYIKNAGVLVYRFGMGLYEADAGDTYTYRYTYTNGDYYEGKFYADPVNTAYYPGQKINVVNELGKTGYYDIKTVSYTTASSSLYGKVYVTKYYDGDKTTPKSYTGTQLLPTNPMYTWFGAGYLKTEHGYIGSRTTSVSPNYFGKGFYEADL